METNRQFRERLAELFGSQNLAALSTHNAGQPYASLVAFCAAADLRHIYFATPKTTRKYANLSADSRRVPPAIPIIVKQLEGSADQK